MVPSRTGKAIRIIGSPMVIVPLVPLLNDSIIDHRSSIIEQH
jgi:hypothetical protein